MGELKYNFADYIKGAPCMGTKESLGFQIYKKAPEEILGSLDFTNNL